MDNLELYLQVLAAESGIVLTREELIAIMEAILLSKGDEPEEEL